METNNTNKDNTVLYNENGERYIYEIVSKKIKSNDKYNFDNSGIYIVTGGLGGIGKLITRWLAERKVGQIILLNRREPTDIEEDEIQKSGAVDFLSAPFRFLGRCIGHYH